MDTKQEIIDLLDKNNTEVNKDIKRNMFEQSEAFTEKNNQFVEEPIGYKKALEDPEENKHLRSICAAFFNYQVDSLRDVRRMERDFNSIREDLKSKLPFNYEERIHKIRLAIWQNYLFLIKIVQPYCQMFKIFKTVIKFLNSIRRTMK